MFDKIAITSGKKYLDIDAYAGMIAYRELLRALEPEREIFAVSSAKLNQSIPQLMRDFQYALDQCSFDGQAKYIVLDVSNPEFIDPIVQDREIIELIDHHPGYEPYWQNRLGTAAQIEPIGSVCTIIWEKFLAAGQERLLNTELSKLLVAGILDNTLNLRAKITNERDRQAYDGLIKVGQVPESWAEEYFTACATEILSDLHAAVLDDLKIEKVSPLLPNVTSQLVLLDHGGVTFEQLAGIFAEQGHRAWLMNVIQLSDGKSYLYFNGEGTRAKLEELLDNALLVDDHLMILEHFMLRKELFRLALEKSKS